ncbi:MAG: hypothetical protein GY715_14435, partial [Planctomycetes bacterium]|nr:hypothetical protein [Planctomycetota bacterium]
FVDGALDFDWWEAVRYAADYGTSNGIPTTTFLATAENAVQAAEIAAVAPEPGAALTFDWGSYLGLPVPNMMPSTFTWINGTFNGADWLVIKDYSSASYTNNWGGINNAVWSELNFFDWANSSSPPGDTSDNRYIGYVKINWPDGSRAAEGWLNKNVYRGPSAGLIVQVEPYYDTFDYWETYRHYEYDWASHTEVLTDARNTLYYNGYSDTRDVFGSEAQYERVTETREIVIGTEDHVNTKTVPVYGTRTVFTTERLDNIAAPVATGMFQADSLSAIDAVGIRAGGNVALSGKITASGATSTVTVAAGADVIVQGAVPENSNILAAVSEVRAGQAIDITAAGTVTVGDAGLLDVDDGGAGSTSRISIDAGADAVVAGEVTSLDRVVIEADDNVALRGDVGSAVLVDVHAGIDGTGSITGDRFGDLATTGGGQINLTAGANSGDIAIDDVALTSATGTVSLIADGGLISHSGATITASSLSARSRSGITANTAVGALGASVTSTGDVAVDNGGDLTLTAVTTQDGAIVVESFGTLAVTRVETLGTSDANDISLSAYAVGSTPSDLDFTTIAAGGLGDVTLDIGGSINAVPTGQVTAPTVVGDRLTVTVPGALDLVTDVVSLVLQTTGPGAGDVTIAETDAIDLVDIEVFDGSLDLVAGGNLTATSVRLLANAADRDIRLESGGVLAVGLVQAGPYVVTAAEAEAYRLLALNTALLNIGLFGDGSDLNASVAQFLTLAEAQAIDQRGDFSQIRSDLIAYLVTQGAPSAEATAEADDILALNATLPGSVAGDVTLVATGAIVEAGTADAGVDLIADALTMTAGGDINGLEVAINELTSASTSGGSIQLADVDGVAEESPGLSVLGASSTSAGAAVDISAEGNLRIGRLDLDDYNQQVITAGTVSVSGTGSSVALRSSAGDVRVLTGGALSAVGSVVIDAAGAIEAPSIPTQVSDRIELRAGETLSFANLASLSFTADTIIIETGGTLEVGTLAATTLVDLASTGGDLVLSGAITNGSGGAVATLNARSSGSGTATTFDQDANSGLVRLLDGNGILYLGDLVNSQYMQWQDPMSGRYAFSGLDEEGADAILTSTAEDPTAGVLYDAGGTVVMLADITIFAPAYTEITDPTVISGLTGETTTVDLGGLYIRGAGEIRASSINLGATSGAVINQGGATRVLTGGALVVDAAEGVDLATDIATLTVTTSGAGDVRIAEAGGLTLTRVSVNDGALDVQAAGTVTVTDVELLTDGADKNVDISTTGSTLLVDLITVGGPTAGVNLSAASVVREVDAFDADIDVNSATVAYGSTPTVLVNPAGVDDSGTYLEISGQAVTRDFIRDVDGDIVIDEDVEGIIDVRATGNIIVTQAISGDGSISLDAGGDIRIAYLDAGASGNTILSAGRSIYEVDAFDADIDLVTGVLTATAGAVTVGGSISGTSADLDLETRIASADLAATTGSIAFDEFDDITFSDDVSVSGSIDVNAGGNITLPALFSAGGNVTLGATGTIGGVGGHLVSATGLAVQATTAITLNTSVDTLAADLSQSGDLSIFESGALTVSSATTNDGSILIEAGGALVATTVRSNFDVDANDITLRTTVGGITLATVNAGLRGDVVLDSAAGITGGRVSADGLAVTASGAVALDTTVTAADVTLDAAGGITLNETDEITLTRLASSDGSVLVTAGGRVVATDVSASGAGADVDLSTTAGGIEATLVGAVSDLTLDADGGDIDLGTVVATSGSVVISADAGAINDADDDLTADISAGTTITLTARDEIGGSPGAGASTDPSGRLELAAGSDVSAVSTGSGAIALRGLGALTLTQVRTENGSIDVMAAGAVSATLVRSTTDSADNDIALSTTSGGIGVGVIDAKALGGVTLIAAGAVGVGQVSADVLEIDAGLGIDLSTDVNRLAARAGTDIAISESDGLVLQGVSTTTGDITVSAQGTIEATGVAARGGSGYDVDLATTTGGIVAANIEAADTVTLDADAGDIDLGTITATLGAIAISADNGAINDLMDSEEINLTAGT